MGQCSIEGCEARHHGRGYCIQHYRKLLKYGDPLKERSGLTPPGSHRRFLDEALINKSDNCLIWPYGKTGDGYPLTKVDRRKISVHRYLCEVVNGPPVPPRIHCAHNCGNKACVNPLHLRWATPIENHADKKVHGTERVGEDNLRSKLTKKDVLKIRELSKLMTVRDVAKIFPVSESAVGRIVNGKTWRHIVLHQDGGSVR